MSTGTLERARDLRPVGSSALPTIDSFASRRSAVAQRVAGALLTAAGVVAVMGWITAEALYSGVYSTHADSLSHLGATEPPNSIVVQPSGSIFDVSMLLVGAMIILSGWFIYSATRSKLVTIPTVLLGLGVFGVGVFPLTSPNQHTIFALIAFLSGGLAMVASSRVTTSPFRYIWGVLGVVALVAIGLAFLAIQWQPIAALGEGGIERWNAYPIVLWLVAFGGYLMSGHLAEGSHPRGCTD
jgi:hypothetical membrane protein